VKTDGDLARSAILLPEGKICITSGGDKDGKAFEEVEAALANGVGVIDDEGGAAEIEERRRRERVIGVFPDGIGRSSDRTLRPDRPRRPYPASWPRWPHIEA